MSDLISFPWRYLFIPVAEHTQKEKAAKGLCRHYRCTRQCRGGGRTDCNTCCSRKRRYNNPVYYAYEALRVSARKRKIGWNLHIDDFRKFCELTGYVEAKGQEPGSMTVDRIDPRLPYQKGNLRPMTHANNSSHKYECKYKAPQVPQAVAAGWYDEENPW